MQQLFDVIWMLYYLYYNNEHARSIIFHYSMSNHHTCSVNVRQRRSKLTATVVLFTDEPSNK